MRQGGISVSRRRPLAQCCETCDYLYPNNISALRLRIEGAARLQWGLTNGEAFQLAFLEHC